MKKSWPQIIFFLGMVFSIFPFPLLAEINLEFEFYRVKSKVSPDLLQKWTKDKKYRKTMQAGGFELYDSRRGKYIVHKTKITSREQLLKLLGGEETLADGQKRMLEVFDFAYQNSQFQELLKKGSLDSKCYPKTKAKDDVLPVILIDTTAVTDITPEELRMDFIPGGQKSVTMSTIYAEDTEADSTLAVFVHEFAHTLDSSSLNYDSKALGRDGLHNLNEITSESNAFSEAWAEYHQIVFFPGQKKRWGGEGLEGFEDNIKVEKLEGTYDEIPVSQIPTEQAFFVPGEGNRKLKPGDLFKTETVNLHFLINISEELDRLYGPGTGYSIISKAFKSLNKQKDNRSDLKTLIAAIIEDNKLDHLAETILDGLEKATRGTMTREELAAHVSQVKDEKTSAKSGAFFAPVLLPTTSKDSVKVEQSGKNPFLE